ncbi:MAG: alpha/beta fold hydrolase [Clostridia bacterium]|nr:alpha/beta fold hydrolase [Clostridia bacterium]
MNLVLRAALCALLLALLLPACAIAEHFDTSIPSRGIQIPATIALPDTHGGRFPVVIFAHGHNGSRDENRGFTAIADALTDLGIASIRIDFAGCGASTESFLNNCLTTMKADLCAAAAYAQTGLRATSIGLFGYSMGGRVVLEALAEGLHADAAVLLAPAADTQDLISSAFKDFSAMHDAAKADGFYLFRADSSHPESLSAAWFDDLMRYPDPARSAAEAYDGPALVIYAQDDALVSPAVSEHVIRMLHADSADASGKGHGYGFFLETDPIREGIAQHTADFFLNHLP